MVRGSQPDPSAPDATHERQVLRGLALEWELALAYASPAQRRCVRRPLFRLADLGRRLGQWDASRREICLSRRLLGQPWEVLREVLRHEMAHQLVSELSATPHAHAPHGTAFGDACRLLRIAPRASSALAELGGRGGHAAEPEASTAGVAGRIRKLLALAGSTHPHEAEAAMLKAHALMQRWHLERLKSPEAPVTLISRFVGRPALRHPREDYALALLLLDFYQVAGIWVQAVVVERSAIGRVLEISGTPAQVETALYVHAFVRRFIDSQWQELRRSEHWSPGTRHGDFALGVIAGLRERLTAGQGHAQPAPSSGTELVAARDPQLQAYLAWRTPRTVRVTSGPLRCDPRVVDHGRQLGRKLIIHRGITGKGPDGALLPWQTGAV